MIFPRYFSYDNGGDMVKLAGQLQYHIEESNWPFSARPTFSFRIKLRYLNIIVIKQILHFSFFSVFVMQNDELLEKVCAFAIMT